MKQILLVFFCLLFSGCGYNSMQRADEEIKSAWSDVLNQYQRRADLIPNLLKTVQGYASHEKEVFMQVTEARAKVGTIQAPEAIINNDEAMKKFQETQAGMTSAISKLLVVAENYPELKADGSFRDLQAQLEGTENRIAVARNRYIQAVKEYNVLVRSFPSNLTAQYFGYTTKANFTVEDEKALATPPVVEFK